jgi:hypothetical protein
VPILTNSGNRSKRRDERLSKQPVGQKSPMETFITLPGRLK